MQTLQAASAVYNPTPISSGTYNINTKLDVYNGEIKLLFIPVNQFDNYKNSSEYYYYTVYTTEPSSHFQFETIFSFNSDFYVILQSKNLIESLQVNGYIDLQTPLANPVSYFNWWIGGGVIGFVVLVGAGIGIGYCCCKKRTYIQVDKNEEQFDL